MGFAEIVPLDLRDLTVLAHILLQHAVLLALGLGVFRVVDVHREPDRLLALHREPDAFVVDEARMLDRVDARADRGLDPLRPVGVSRDAQAPMMRLIGDRPQFLLRKLLLPGRRVAREDAARGAGLDDFRAELALAADLIFQLVGSVADALSFFLLQARRKESVVAVATGRAERMPGGDDARPDCIARLDGLLEPDVVPLGRSDHCGWW